MSFHSDPGTALRWALALAISAAFHLLLAAFCRQPSASPNLDCHVEFDLATIELAPSPETMPSGGSPAQAISAPPRPEAIAPAQPEPPDMIDTGASVRPLTEPISNPQLPDLEPVIPLPVAAAAPNDKNMDSVPTHLAPADAADAGAISSVTDQESAEIVGHAEISKRFKPSYPLSARANGLEGTVYLSVRVSAQGRVAGIEVVQSSGHEILDEAALRAVRKASFRPAQSKAGPIETTVSLPVRFRLKD